MAKEKKHIEKSIRARFLDAVDEIKSKGVKEGVTYKDIFENLDSFQQVHTQMREGSRFPTVKEIVLLHKKYSYSLQWLMIGIGNKKVISKAISKANAISLIEEGLSILKQQKKSISSTK